jgi:hypothetical protein
MYSKILAGKSQRDLDDLGVCRRIIADLKIMACPGVN